MKLRFPHAPATSNNSRKRFYKSHVLMSRIVLGRTRLCARQHIDHEMYYRTHTKTAILTKRDGAIKGSHQGIRSLMKKEMSNAFTLPSAFVSAARKPSAVALSPSS